MFKKISSLLGNQHNVKDEGLVWAAEGAEKQGQKAGLHGDLAIVGIEDIMQLVCNARLSGELHLRCPDNAASFIIRDGCLIFGYLQDNSRKIGERLIQEGLITPENLQECLAQYQQKTDRPRLGQLLIERGFLDENELTDVITEQIRDIFFEVLYWKSGSFSFCSNKYPPEEDILLDERIDYLLIEGVVQMDEV